MQNWSIKEKDWQVLGKAKWKIEDTRIELFPEYTAINERTRDILVDGYPRIISRCFAQLPSSNFVASFKMSLQTFDNVTGEGKFIFSHANASNVEDEHFRIDFLANADVTRLTVRGRQYAFHSELENGREYLIKVSVQRNFVSLWIDDMQIVPGIQFGGTSDGYIGFGSYNAGIQVSDIHFEPFREFRCFVMMPFDDKRNFLYESAIKPILKGHPNHLIECVRADESNKTGKVSSEICEEIAKSDILIADITGTNLNVYYEVGYAHALRKEPILLFEQQAQHDFIIPFDIRDYRHHVYEFSKEGFDNAKKRIQELVENEIKRIQE